MSIVDPSDFGPQYPQVQTALTDPGAFAPYVWDAVLTVAVGIKNLQVCDAWHGDLSLYETLELAHHALVPLQFASVYDFS